MSAGVVRSIPLGRAGEPGDNAAMLVILVGPGVRGIAGQEFPVSRGS